MPTFTTRPLVFNFEPSSGRFTLHSSDRMQPKIDSACVWVEYRRSERLFRAPDTCWSGGKEILPAKLPYEMGECRQTAFQFNLDDQGGIASVNFALSQTSPMFFWQISIENRGSTPIFLERITMLDEVALTMPTRIGTSPQPAVFCNGWQSWTFSATYGANDPIRRSGLGPIRDPMMFPYPIKNRLNNFSSEFYTFIGDRGTRKGLVAGFLSQKQAFGRIDVDLDDSSNFRVWEGTDGVRVDPGQSFTSDWAVLMFADIDQPEPLAPYLDLCAEIHDTHLPESIPAGWCSWYHYYTKVTAKNIQDNLQALSKVQDRLPLNLVQIDDGFESQVGDWLTFKNTFPNGVEPLAREIKAAGMIPGLWLAPFILHPQAKICRDHPDWILRGKSGRPVNAGFVWNAFTHALDITHPDALEYAAHIIDTAAHEWGFPYLKLDFLYAAALPGIHHDPTLTRAQILRRGLERLREAAGKETFLLGCGAPLGSSLGLFEAMRIGTDVAGEWHPSYFGVSFVFKNEPDMPSALGAIQNILTRAHQHKHWWINDPDCLLVRPDTKLTLAEVQSLATAIGMTGGSLLLSDNLPALPEDRLHMAEVFYPVIEHSAEVLDWFDRVTPQYLRLPMRTPAGEQTVLAYFNWDDQPQQVRLMPLDFQLSDGNYWMRSFWEQRSTWVTQGDALWSGIVPPHGTVLMTVRPAQVSLPAYLGSDLHFTQGLELKNWYVQADRLEFMLDINRKASGKIELALPQKPLKVLVDDKPVDIENAGAGKYRLAVKIDTQVKVLWLSQERLTVKQKDSSR